MTTEPVCLTLIAARQLRQELFDYLSGQSDLVSGFTASEVAGHGPSVQLQTASERVKGHAEHILVRIILDNAAAQKLLEGLKTTFAGTHLVYWIMPVAEFGLVDGDPRTLGHVPK
jgi:hypothetical protein